MASGLTVGPYAITDSGPATTIYSQDTEIHSQTVRSRSPGEIDSKYVRCCIPGYAKIGNETLSACRKLKISQLSYRE